MSYSLAKDFKNLKKIHERGFELSREEIDVLIQHVENLYERLECNFAFNSKGDRVEFLPGTIPDGIECRDETIKGYKNGR